MLARLLLVALLTLMPATAWAETTEFDDERGYRCRLDSQGVDATLYCWDQHAASPSSTPGTGDSWWYQCALRKYERYVRADCRDPKAEWTQVTPIGWWP